MAMLKYTGISSKGFNCLGALISVACLSACVGTKTPKAEAWVDQEENALVKSWGPPAQVYQSGARKFLVYLSSGSACRHTFEIKDSKVVAWNAKGSGCK